MNLRDAREFYLNKKYKEIYVPTLVDADVINITCPAKEDLKNDNDLYHVASAEQGFIQLLKDGFPLNGKYFSISSCYRPADKNKGELYLEWFLKLELFDSIPKNYSFLLLDARKLYSEYLKTNPDLITIQPTSIGLDLVYNKIEIGSYGKRNIVINNKHFEFAYGTGFVPFRLNKAKK